MTDIYAPLDPGISELVALLRSKGVDTFSSCEGGPGHDFAMPTIRINPRNEYMDEEEIEIARILSEADYGGYYIKLCHSYQNDPSPWRENFQNFIEIEFWAYPLKNNTDKSLDLDDSISPIGNI